MEPINSNFFISDLRQSLADSLPGAAAQNSMSPSLRPTIHPSGRRYDVKRQSAVMILLYFDEGQLKFVCIKRPEYDGPHGGQISLPGGKYDSVDEDLKATAIRETFEEVGVLINRSQIIGKLTKLFIPISNIDVTPYVGFLPHPPLFIADEKEVDYLIEIPLTKLLDSSCLHEEKRVLSGQIVKVPYFLLNGEKIWGATAMMLSEFVAVICKLNALEKAVCRKYI